MRLRSARSGGLSDRHRSSLALEWKHRTTETDNQNPQEFTNNSASTPGNMGSDRGEYLLVSEHVRPLRRVHFSFAFHLFWSFGRNYAGIWWPKVHWLHWKVQGM